MFIFLYLPLYPLTIAGEKWRVVLWNALPFLFHSSLDRCGKEKRGLDRWPMEEKGPWIGGDS